MFGDSVRLDSVARWTIAFIMNTLLVVDFVDDYIVDIVCGTLEFNRDFFYACRKFELAHGDFKCFCLLL